jgi:putative tricarboxylic transport membrane protein
LWVRLLTIPKPWLYGGILLFATLGTIGINPAPAELAMLILFGVLGYLMRVYGYPIAPVIVGLILGPMAEQQLRRALAIAQGDVWTLVHSPLAAALLALAALALVVPLVMRLAGRGQVLQALASDED